MPTRIRRIVTAQDSEGKSYALFDQDAANIWEIPHRKGVFVTQLWSITGNDGSATARSS